MSIEKAAEAILAEGQRTGRMARPTGEFPACEKADKEASLAFAHAALPHLLEEPTEGEITRAVVKFNESCMQLALNDFVRRRNALPHLLKEPTEEELEECRALLDSLLKESQCGGGRVVAIGTRWAQEVLNQFVRRRNAPPEPPEPSHVVELCDVYGHNTSYYGIASVRLDGVTVYSAI